MLRGTLCALILIVMTPVVEGRAEFQVNDYTQHDQTCPVVAMNAAGDFAVAWRSHVADGRGGGVYVRCFQADGTPIGDEVRAGRARVDVASWTPAVGISAAGDVVVAWVAVDNGDRDIVARMFNAQGQPLTEEFPVNEFPEEALQSTPSIAMNEAGQFVIVWTSCVAEDDGPRRYVAGRLYGPDGVAVGKEFRIAKRAQACWPDVAMDDAGGFVVSWIRMADTFNRPYGEYIMFRRYGPDGEPVGDAAAVTGDLNSRWYGPSVAAASSGQFAITWAIGPFPYDIVMQTYDADGLPLTEPYIINTCLDGNQGHPRVAADAEGEYLVVWDSQSQDGSCHGVFGQLCNCMGNLKGCEMALNSFMTGRQWYPDVAMAADGRYVVVWISEGQDGSGYGVFGETGAN